MENSSKTPKEIMSHWHLGQTSSKYETGNRGISTISTGRGDHGGVSYGAYQLSSKMGTLQKFLRHSKYEEYFSGLHPATQAFNSKWRDLALHDPAFRQAEHAFIEQNHYKPELHQLKKHGIPIDTRGKAVHDMLWSTSVQYGCKASDIFEAALKGHDIRHTSDAQWIEAVQDYKLKHVHQHFRNSPELWHSLEKRIQHEKSDLLKLAHAEHSVISHLNNDPHKGQSQSDHILSSSLGAPMGVHSCVVTHTSQPEHSEVSALSRHADSRIAAFHDRVQHEPTLGGYSELERTRIAAASLAQSQRMGLDVAGLTELECYVHPGKGQAFFVADDPVKAARNPYTSSTTVDVGVAVQTPVAESLALGQGFQAAQSLSQDQGRIHDEPSVR